MSTSVLETPVSLLRDWADDGSRKSIGGVQKRLLHRPTGSEILLSPDGEREFNHGSNLADIMGRWAMLCEEAPLIIKADSYPRVSYFCRRIPAFGIATSGASYNRGLGFSDATVYRPKDNSEVLIKTFDFNPKSAIRQFDTMLYLSEILGKRPAADSQKKFRVPGHYALMFDGSGDTATIFMEDASANPQPTLPNIGVPWNPSSKDEGFGGIKALLRSEIGILGRLLANDLRPPNLIKELDEDTGEVTYALIDQPTGKRIEIARILVPLANLVSRATIKIS